MYLSSVGEDTLDFHEEIAEYIDNHSTKLAFQPGTFQIKFGYETIREIYEVRELFFCNKQEAQRILETDEADMKELVKEMHNRGPNIAVLTDGRNGAWAYDGTDGWYLEHRGDHPDDTTGDAVLERDGREVYRETNVGLRRAVTAFARAKLQSGWYGVTRQDWERSYTNNGDQENETVVTASADGARGPRMGNLPVHFSVTADSSTSGLVLSAGSAAQVNLGRTTPLTRSKAPEPFTDTVGSVDTYVPLRAFRVDPDRDIVNVQLKTLDVLRYSSDALVTVATNAAPDSEVSFGGTDSWSTPPPTTPSSSILETRSDVSTIPDRSGTAVSTTTAPGPFSLNTATLTPTGQQFQKGASNDPSRQKRTLPRDDIAVVFGKSGTTGDVTYTIGDEEDW
jgi:hypothetical protein